MRALPARWYHHSATVYPSSASLDSFDGPRDSWPEEGATIACRVQRAEDGRAAPKREVADGQVVTTTSWVVRVPEDPGVDVDAKVEWMGRVMLALGPAYPTRTGDDGVPTDWAFDCEERR